MASSRPFFVGIAGGTGSGKTTIAQTLEGNLPPNAAVLINHDSYYKDRSGMPAAERDLLNFDHPDALDNALLIQHLDELAQGRPVEAPIYDYVNHVRGATTRRVEPTQVVIVEGILIFADPEIRRRFDAKVFVDTDADIRIFRRMRRDIESRGRTFAQVHEQYHLTVRPMHLEFVEPSKRYADILIPEGGDNHVAIDMLLSKLESVVGYRR